MRTPDSLNRLLEYGIIQEVVRPLMSGKEAQVYLVTAEGQGRVAKVYKEAQGRTFKHRAEYTEGRKTRSSRDQRAMSKRSRHGRAQDEAAWRSTEVDVIHRLRDAGVRVPEPGPFSEGVLVMELIVDADGNPAPRLGDLSFEPDQALAIYHELISQVVRMLCAGVVHGDLSEFNVLMGAKGPTIIDLPQAVDPARNENARRLLLRDVENLHRFLARLAPRARRPRYAEEMWEQYQSARLRPTTQLTGDYRPPQQKADTREVLALIEEAGAEEDARREARGQERRATAPDRFRTVADFSRERPQASGRRRQPAAEPNPAATTTPTSAAATAPPEKRRRRRRRRGRRVGAPSAGASSPSQSPAAPPATRARRRAASSQDAARGEPARPADAATTPVAPATPRARRRRRRGRAPRPSPSKP